MRPPGSVRNGSDPNAARPIASAGTELSRRSRRLGVEVAKNRLQREEHPGDRGVERRRDPAQHRTDEPARLGLGHARGSPSTDPGAEPISRSVLHGRPAARPNAGARRATPVVRGLRSRPAARRINHQRHLRPPVAARLRREPGPRIRSIPRSPVRAGRTDPSPPAAAGSSRRPAALSSR